MFVVIFTDVIRGKRNPLYFDIPGRLEAVRLRANLAQHALSLAAGMSHTTAQEVAAGHVPGVDTVEKLADVLKVSPSFIAYGEEHPWTLAPAPRYEGVRARLKRIRVARGMGRKPLGKASGTSDTAIRVIESGPSVPGVDTIEKLAKGLKCSPGWLAFGEGTDPLVESSDSGTPSKGLLLSLVTWFILIGRMTK